MASLICKHLVPQFGDLISLLRFSIWTSMDSPNLVCQEHLGLNKSIQLSRDFSEIFLFDIPLILINILPVTPVQTLCHLLFTPSSSLAFTSNPSYQVLAILFLRELFLFLACYVYWEKNELDMHKLFFWYKISTCRFCLERVTSKFAMPRSPSINYLNSFICPLIRDPVLTNTRRTVSSMWDHTF